MATPKWQPGKLYPPGSLVVPRTDQGASPQHIPNPGFEDGDTGWNKTSGWAIIENPQAYQGSWFARYSGTGENGLHCSTDFNVVPGQTITLSAYYRAPGEGDGAGGRVTLVWMDSDKNTIRVDGPTANFHRTGHYNNWRLSSITASAPANARFVRPSFSATINNGSNPVDVDSFTWSYSPPVAANLQYKAVQPASGYSDTVEPAWPGVLGQQVVDNEVIWEAVSVSRVVWEAQPILKTGESEPDWPDMIGGSVADGTISWSAADPMTSDPNCPHSKVVVIAKFKVYAGDGDIVRYTATLAPQDWTTEKDAGYLGTGVQQNGANKVAVMNLYRANLIVMNATTFQQWQIDPDPALMDLLDTMDGIGSIHHLAAQPVGNELFYLSNRGVRSVGVSGISHNLKAGDVGLPVDPIVAGLMHEAEAAGIPPLGLYLPSMGQYWLAFNRVVPDDGPDGPAIGSARDLCPTLEEGDRYAEVMVYTMNQVGQVGAWSRYVFPYAIDDWTQEGNDLYVRDGDTVYRVSEDIGACDFLHGESTPPAPFSALIQWPWLDMGRPGADKQMESYDLVGYGEADVEFGYDQTAPGYFTEPYRTSADTVPGTTVPMPLSAPSYSVRLRYHGWNPQDPETEAQKHWSFNAMGINFTR